MNAVAKHTPVPSQEGDGDALAAVVLAGDLSKLRPDEKVAYYNAVCRSVGLNPFTQPFEYTKLNGKEVLYARKSCAEQLRQIHSLTIQVVDKSMDDELYVVTVRASNPAGRMDEDLGAVTIAGMRGEARANAIMKAITKAKRRVTLSFCGLGMLDEGEVESVVMEHRRSIAPPSQPIPATRRLADVTRAQNIIDHGNRPSPVPSEPNADLGGDGIPDFGADPLRDRVDAAIQAFSAATSLAQVDKGEAKVQGLFADIVAANRADLGPILEDHIAAVRSRFPAPAIEGMPAA